MRQAYPFSAIVGQDEMKLALLLAAIEPAIGGVLIFGDRGTAKSTAVRALSALLPSLRVTEGCRYGCDPNANGARCADCHARDAQQQRVRTRLAPVAVVDLPLGATEDRVAGALDIERALVHGEKVFEPGLLARAHRGFLYVDEINLLEDHLVDLLLDVAASGENVVEREGLSVKHPARFVLIGTGNPEEGELRPQLLDRFGLSVEARTSGSVPERVEIVRRRDAFERQDASFIEQYRRADALLRRRIVRARSIAAAATVPDAIIECAAELCVGLGVDGSRGELTLIRAARALAAFHAKTTIGVGHLTTVAPLVLRHRLRRNPLDDVGSTARIERALAQFTQEAGRVGR